MSISDELTKLAELRDRGILSADEFEQAKDKVLSGGDSSSDKETDFQTKSYRFEDRSDDSVGRAANRYVSFQMIMAVVGIVIFLLFFAPLMCSSDSPFSSKPKIQFSPGVPR